MRVWLLSAAACAVAVACADDDKGGANGAPSMTDGGMSDAAAGAPDVHAGGEPHGSAGTTSAGSSGGGSPGSAGATSEGGNSELPPGGSPAAGGDGGATGDPTAELDPRCATASAQALLGAGTEQDPYLICLPQQLSLLDTAQYPLSKSFALGDELDVSGLTPPLLGGDAEPVSGSFDGRNHRISGLTVPLFGTIQASGHVLRLKLSGTLAGQSQFGLLAHYNYGLIEHVHVDGSFEVADHSGALLGTNYSTGKLYRCSSSGAISKGYNHVGGLVGENDGLISESSSRVDVNAQYRVGGLVGNLTMPGVIERSFATGKVTGTMSVGGLVGTFFSGEVRDSYARSELVTGPAAGGLVGHIYGAAKITNTYALCGLSGTDTHGLVGLVQGSPSVTVTSSYYGNAASDSVGTALSLAAMKEQASFDGWDFDGVWQMKASISELPSLRFQ